MTPERQRIKIAEACGWQEVTKSGSYPEQIQGLPPCAYHARPAPSPDERDTRSWYWVPDYLNDLNAMHAAERRLNINQLSEYADRLEAVCVPIHICPLTHWQAVVMATSAQRAEAFLRTLNLWEEDK